MSDELEKRKKQVLEFLTQKKKWIINIILLIIIYLGAFIRTRNIPLTQWKYPLALDPYVMLRYAEHHVNTGVLMTLDTMRSFPLGFAPKGEFTFITTFLSTLHKILDIFVQNLTVAQTHIIYPVICFIIGIIFFYLTLKKLFNFKIALLSSAFLVVIPTYLYRTMAGFSDKEPLAMMLLFMTFYFFTLAWNSKTNYKNILFGALAGITTAFTALTWGGALYIFLIIGLFGFISLILNKFTKHNIYAYGTWVIFLTLILSTMSYGRFNLQGLLVSFSTGIVYVVFFIVLINFLIFKKNIFKIKDKITKKIPQSIFSIIVGMLLIIIFASIFFGPKFIPGQIQEITNTMINPLTNRWALTVAESHQPYAQDWYGQMGKTYVWAFILGSVLMFAKAMQKLKKDKYWLTLLYILFILSFIFSRFSRESNILNGVSPLAKFMYIGSIIIFALIMFIYYIRSYYKDKDKFNILTKIDIKYIFAFSWFIIMLMSARSAVRLIFVFSTATALMTGYAGIRLIELSLKIKEKLFKYLGVILICILLITSFTGFAKASIHNAQYTGPSYNQQWQTAGEWTQNNTPEDSVFAHWWDYGYWVQTGFKRATITDGGNVIGSWNYYMGRHVITGQTENEALEFLKPHKATHLLMISDEVGKYPAFSSIGSDENYDRYSWINIFNMDESRTQETREGKLYLYTGGTMLDEDFIYQEKLFPKEASGIAAFIIESRKIQTEDKTAEPIVGASAILVYNGEQVTVPLACVFVKEDETIINQEGLPGCLRIIPKIDGPTNINPIGSALYLSQKVRRTLFTKLYLYGKESSNFKIVYNDESSLPLAFYQGRLIGPLKIWEINYPSYIKSDPKYLEIPFPNINVTKI